MSENFDFDSDLNALLGLSGASTTPATTSSESAEAAAPAPQPEHQETASGLPEHDLVALLDPEGLARQPQHVAEPAQVPEASAKGAQLPVMYDETRRKLGPVGVLVTLRGDLRRAQAAGNDAEVRRLMDLIQEADKSVDEFSKRSGLSRAQLMPTFETRQANDRDEAIKRIQELRKKHDELEAQIKQGGLSGRIYTLRLRAQYCRGEASLLARQAGLLDQDELALASRYGFWALMPPAVVQAPRGERDGNGGHQMPESAHDIQIQEGDRQ